MGKNRKVFHHSSVILLHPTTNRLQIFFVQATRRVVFQELSLNFYNELSAAIRNFRIKNFVESFRQFLFLQIYFLKKYLSKNTIVIYINRNIFVKHISSNFSLDIWRGIIKIYVGKNIVFVKYIFSVGIDLVC